MIRGQLEALAADPILVDPLAGMLLWRDGRRTRNQHLAWGSTVRWLGQSREHAHIFKRRGIQNEIFGEGAIIGRDVFSNTLHRQAAQAYRRFEVAETIARDRREFDRRIGRLEGAVAKDGGKYQLWYRGQTRDFLLPDRARLVEGAITPYSNIQDSSLVPSLYRKADAFFGEPAQYETFARGIEEWNGAAGMLWRDRELKRDLFQTSPLRQVTFFQEQHNRQRSRSSQTQIRSGRCSESEWRAYENSSPLMAGSSTAQSSI
jgi:hypothetical protein